MGTKSAWTEERRQRQAEIIRKTKPWKHSTGPRTEAGKQASSRNATSIWVARRRALKAVSQNNLAQVRLFAEVLGIDESELFANRHRGIDFKMATEDQQDRYIDLLWDEIDLKAEFFSLWPADINCEEYFALDGPDWSDWSGDLEYKYEFGGDVGHSHDNDNDDFRKSGLPRFTGVREVGSEISQPSASCHAVAQDRFVQPVAQIGASASSKRTRPT